MNLTLYDLLAGCTSTIEISDFVTNIDLLLDHPIREKHRHELESSRPLFERLSKKHPGGAMYADISRKDFDSFIKGIATVLDIAATYGENLFYPEPKGGLQ
jgi:hypothetical protein